MLLWERTWEPTPAPQAHVLIWARPRSGANRTGQTGTPPARPGRPAPDPRRPTPPPGTRGRAPHRPTCARRALRAVRPLGRAQRAPEAGRQVARGPARQGQDGRGPALRRRPPPRRARQVPRAWQLAPVHHLEVFSGLRPRPPLRRAAVAPAGGHLGRVTWPRHVAARVAPPAGGRAGVLVGALAVRLSFGRVFLLSSPAPGWFGGRGGPRQNLSSARRRTRGGCVRAGTWAFSPFGVRPARPGTQPPDFVFFGTRVPLFYFQFIVSFFYFVIFPQQSSGQALERAGKETKRRGRKQDFFFLN